MAMWKAEVDLPNGSRDFLYFSAADARSMKRAALIAAVRDAAKKVKAKFAERGLKVSVVACNCVG